MKAFEALETAIKMPYSFITTVFEAVIRHPRRAAVFLVTALGLAACGTPSIDLPVNCKTGPTYNRSVIKILLHSEVALGRGVTIEAQNPDEIYVRLGDYTHIVKDGMTFEFYDTSTGLKTGIANPAETATDPDLTHASVELTVECATLQP